MMKGRWMGAVSRKRQWIDVVAGQRAYRGSLVIRLLFGVLAVCAKCNLGICVVF